MNKRRTSALAGLVLGLAVAPGASAVVPIGPQPITKDMCKDGGYTDFAQANGQAAFENQGGCVSASNDGAQYVAGTDGHNIIKLVFTF
jgi:hypothetical protein